MHASYHRQHACSRLVNAAEARYDAIMRYLGIDYGTKKVGLALSDDAGTMGFPHSVIPNDPRLLELLKELVVREHVEGIVMGQSLDMKGGENPVATEARAFATRLHEATQVPISWEQELYTTQEARRDFEGVHNNRGVVDASAAAIILTSFLSRQPHNL